MSPEEIAQLVARRFKKCIFPTQEFSAQNSAQIEKHYNCVLPSSFIEMRGMIGIYQIDGDYLPLDEMIATSEIEKTINPVWEDDFLPFYSVGNGDHLCFRISECPNSRVYYVPHDEEVITTIHNCFDTFLADAEWFS